MKTDREFKDLYLATLLPLLKEMDKLRLKTRRKNFYTSIGFIGLIIALSLVGFIVNRNIYGVWISETKANVPIVILLISVIVLFFTYKGKNASRKSRYVETYKNTIIVPIVRFFEEMLHYDAKGYIQVQDFINSNLFLQKPDSYRGDDLVSGKIGKTDVAFSEVHARYKTTTTDEDGNNKDKWTKIFDGLFYKADFHKDFKGKHVVLSNSGNKTMGIPGKIIRHMSNMYGEPVRLENIGFEKHFSVFGSDPVEVRYILSTNMMQRLLDFSLRTGKNISISFVKSCIFIAIPYKKEVFDPNYRKSVVNEEKTKEYFNDLKMAIDIVEDLNLNTRIWSKQ